MSIFPNGIVTCEKDFLDLTDRSTINAFNTMLGSSPFQSVMYHCPKGSGKTTLVRFCLSEHKRKQLAAERRLLIRGCPLSSSFLQNDAGVFCCLKDALVESISVLDEDTQTRLRARFRAETEKSDYDGYQEDKKKAFELIKAVAEILKREDYFAVLLIEDFHVLSNSTTCDRNTFNNMAYLDQLGLLAYIVLSDYHVSIGSKEYSLSEFERIFGERLKTVSPSKKPRCRAVLFEKIRAAIRSQQFLDELEPSQEFDISEQELDLMMQLTDGIPGMVQNAVDAYYTARVNQNGGALTPEEFNNVVLEGCRPLMREWVRYLKDTAHWDTLRIIFEDPKSDSTTALDREKDKSTVLTDMHLLTLVPEKRRYFFNSPLFERFVAEELRRPVSLDQIIKSFGEKEKGTINVTINNSTNIDNSQKTVYVEKAVIAPGLTASAILQMLNPENAAALPGDGRAGYAAALADRFGTVLKKMLPGAGNAGAPAETELQQDAAFDAFGKQLIQDVEVDEEQDLIDVTPEELQTLDQRFRELRERNVRPEMTDRLLNALNESSRLYLKLSAVVEDALSFMRMDDYSPQLVLYGKALEQTLRDNFYDLFRNEETLRNTIVDNGKQFFELDRDKAYIFAYQTVIRSNAAYLSQLAERKDVRFMDEFLNAGWWGTLQHEIHESRSIRNRADHPSSLPPTKEDVDEMVRILLGDGNSAGLLLKSKTGKYLHNRILTGDSSVGALLEKDTCEATVAEILDNKKLKASLEDCSIPVRISSKKVERFLLAHPEIRFTPEMRISVKLLEYKNNADGDYFVADILSA